MIEKAYLTDSQHMGLDRIEEDEAVLQMKKGRFLNACARELNLDPAKIRFDMLDRSFYWMSSESDAKSTTQSGAA